MPLLNKKPTIVVVLSKGILLFYRELLQYFEDFKNITNVFPNGEFILWNNKSITIADETLFWKTWFERGVVFVQDVLHDYGNFLSLEEFKNKFNININYLHYFQLIAAIPSYLKKRAAQTAVPQYVFSSTLASLPDGNSIDLAEMRCKKYCQLLNECGSIVPSGAGKWEERYPEYFTDWREIFRAIYKLTRDNELRQFCFRLLHRITVTKRELKSSGLVIW